MNPNLCLREALKKCTNNIQAAHMRASNPVCDRLCTHSCLQETVDYCTNTPYSICTQMCTECCMQIGRHIQDPIKNKN